MNYRKFIENFKEQQTNTSRPPCNQQCVNDHKAVLDECKANNKCKANPDSKACVACNGHFANNVKSCNCPNKPKEHMDVTMPCTCTCNQREQGMRTEQKQSENRGDNRSENRGDNRGDNRDNNLGENRGDNRGNNLGENRGDNRGENRESFSEHFNGRCDSVNSGPTREVSKNVWEDCYSSINNRTGKKIIGSCSKWRNLLRGCKIDCVNSGSKRCTKKCLKKYPKKNMNKCCKCNEPNDDMSLYKPGYDEKYGISNINKYISNNNGVSTLQYDGKQIILQNQDQMNNFGNTFEGFAPVNEVVGIYTHGGSYNKFSGIENFGYVDGHKNVVENFTSTNYKVVEHAENTESVEEEDVIGNAYSGMSSEDMQKQINNASWTENAADIQIDTSVEEPSMFDEDSSNLNYIIAVIGILFLIIFILNRRS